MLTKKYVIENTILTLIFKIHVNLKFWSNRLYRCPICIVRFPHNTTIDRSIPMWASYLVVSRARSMFFIYLYIIYVYRYTFFLYLSLLDFFAILIVPSFACTFAYSTKELHRDIAYWISSFRTNTLNLNLRLCCNAT